MLAMDMTRDRFILLSICVCVCCLYVGFPGASRFPGTAGLPESVGGKHSVGAASRPPFPASLYFTKITSREHIVFNLSTITFSSGCRKLVKVVKVGLSLMLM